MSMMLPPTVFRYIAPVSRTTSATGSACDGKNNRVHRRLVIAGTAMRGKLAILSGIVPASKTQRADSPCPRLCLDQSGARVDDGLGEACMQACRPIPVALHCGRFANQTLTQLLVDHIRHTVKVHSLQDVDYNRLQGEKGKNILAHLKIR
jgi:hypothetical protein